jgi:hypothetical protein
MKITGGGYNSNKVVNTQNPKREPVVYGVSPGAVSRQGSMVGEGTPYKSLQTQGSAYSNPVVPQPSIAGPGGGRVVMRAGSQAHHGPDRPMGPGRKII